MKIDGESARVDFYVLAGSGEASRQHFACRLAEKAYRLKHKVHILAADPGQAARLDELLWTFRDGSFVPHELAGAAEPDGAPVTIGCTTDGLPAVDLLINLTNAMPEHPEAFPRVAEIVTSDEDCKQRSRKRFADYRKRGHSLQMHEL